ncbi:MAG: GNAT family N-acetyltransferase [Planctomycetes bacterium]|nr:GNAT family N-acetyltransferase [Planctomycetota bacterium]
MKVQLNIRLYDHARDARSFAALNYRTFRDSIPQVEFVDDEDFRRHHAWLLKQFAPHDPRKATVFVAEIDDVYAGHCWLGQQTDFFTRRVDPWIFDLSVVPEFQEQGIARALHDAVEEHARKHGAKLIGLQVMAHNQGAAEMYEKFGYTQRAFSLKKHL